MPLRLVIERDPASCGRKTSLWLNEFDRDQDENKKYL